MMKNMSKTNKIIMIVVGLLILVWGVTYKNWWGLLGIIPLILAFMGGGEEPKKEETPAPEAPKVPQMPEEPKEEEEKEMPKMEMPKEEEEKEKEMQV